MRLRKRFLLTAVGATVAGLGISPFAAGQSAFEPLPPVAIGTSLGAPVPQQVPLSPPVTITPASATTAAPTVTPIIQAAMTDIAPMAPSTTGSPVVTPIMNTASTPPATPIVPSLVPDVPVAAAKTPAELPAPAIPPTAVATPSGQPTFVPATNPTPTPPSTGLVPLAQPPVVPATSAPSTGTTAIPLQPLEQPKSQTPALAPVTPTPAASSTTAMYPVSNTVAPTVASQPSLAVKQVLPDQIAPGQPIVADVTVTNTGGRTAESVVITGWWTSGYDLSQESVASNQMNGKRAWGMGAISAGETRTVRLKLTPASNAPSTMEFRSGFDATFSSAVTDTRSVKVLKPELGLTIAAVENTLIGQPLTILVKVKNSSPVPVANVNVVVRLPEHLRHASGRADLETDVPSLAAGATETIPLEVIAMKPGECRAKVRVSAPNCDPLENDVRFTAIEPKLAVNLHGPKTLYQNWPATYEAVIENQGDQPLKAVSLEVKLPAGFRDLRASDKPMYDPASHRLVWTVPALKPGEKRTVVWFGLAKQSEDLVTTSTISVGNMPIRRAEWSTKNAGVEAK